MMVVVIWCDGGGACPDEMVEENRERERSGVSRWRTKRQVDLRRVER
jgi:hypothetical protein